MVIGGVVGVVTGAVVAVVLTVVVGVVELDPPPTVVDVAGFVVVVTPPTGFTVVVEPDGFGFTVVGVGWPPGAPALSSWNTESRHLPGDAGAWPRWKATAPASTLRPSVVG